MKSLPDVFLFRVCQYDYVASIVSTDNYHVETAHEYDPNVTYDTGGWDMAEMLKYFNDAVWTYLGPYMPEVETLELSAGNLEEVL